MFGSSLKGVKPTVLFKELVAADPGLTNSELASRFVESFDRIDSEARQVIWYWERPGGRRGLKDDYVDESLEQMLRLAGYVITKEDGAK